MLYLVREAECDTQLQSYVVDVIGHIFSSGLNRNVFVLIKVDASIWARKQLPKKFVVSAHSKIIHTIALFDE